MARKLVLTNTELTDLTAPKLITVDPIEVVGSMLLIDPTHPAGAWSAGVPASGGAVPNVLSAFAAPVVGFAAATLDPVYTSLNMAGARGLVERSGKGGLHAIYSNTDPTNTSTQNSCYAHLALPTNLKTYLLANWGNAIYMSLWTNITRVAPNQIEAVAISQLVNGSSATSNYKLYFDRASTRPSSPNLGKRYSTYNHTDAAGNRLLNSALSGYTGSIPVNVAGMQAFPFIVGNYGTINQYQTAKAGQPAAILYRYYLEDLTVSGRTYAQVDAIDLALYTKEVLTSGGRYYNDTFTAPSTVP